MSLHGKQRRQAKIREKYAERTLTDVKMRVRTFLLEHCNDECAKVKQVH
jgi:hypothetical protein